MNKIKLKKIISSFKKDIIEYDIEDNYCIIVYSVINFCKHVLFIYKNIESFEKNFLQDESNIDSIFGIDVELYKFD